MHWQIAQLKIGKPSMFYFHRLSWIYYPHSVFLIEIRLGSNGFIWSTTYAILVGPNILPIYTTSNCPFGFFIMILYSPKNFGFNFDPQHCQVRFILTKSPTIYLHFLFARLIIVTSIFFMNALDRFNSFLSYSISLLVEPDL